MKLTKTGIGLLTRLYRSVLHKCFLINAGLFFALAPSAADAEDWGYFETGIIPVYWGHLSSGEYDTYDWQKGNADLAFGVRNGQVSMQIDGWFYQNEGSYRVLDQSDAISSVTSGSNKLVTSGAVYSAIDALDNNYYMNYGDSMAKSFIKAANDNHKNVIVRSAKHDVTIFGRQSDNTATTTKQAA